MASKYPVKSGYKYSFYRTRLGEPVKCSLKEFNQYNNYIQHRMIDLNRQYVKEQEHIRKQIDSINKSNAKLVERIHKREQYKMQLLKKMEKNWRKNDLWLLSQMRKERSQKLQPIEIKKMPVSRLFDDSADVSSLSSCMDFSANVHKEKRVSVSGTSKTKTTSLPVTIPKHILLKPDPPVCDLRPVLGMFGDPADVTSPIAYTDFSTNTVSPCMSTSIETLIKSDIPVCDLQHFKDTYSLIFQKIFEDQGAYLTSVSGELVEIVFDRITSHLNYAKPGHDIGFTPVKTVAKEKLNDIKGKSPCRYLISRLEVMSAASEIVENALRKWHEIAVHKFSIQYEDIFEERTTFKKLYKFFLCANNQEEMYKATLPTATESILESSEEIVKIVLAHLEKFAKLSLGLPFKQQSAEASMKRTSTNSDDNALETRSLSDIFRPHEQSQSILKKELETLAKSINQPEHKVHVSIQKLITTILNIIGADIDYERRQETGKKIAISPEEMFLLYKYLEKNNTPSKKELLRNYSRILRFTKSQESNVSRELFPVPASEDQLVRAVIEEVNIPGMVSCLEDENDKHSNMKAQWTKLDHARQCRGYFENVNFVSSPLDNQDKLDYNCFLLNMFNFDHLMHSQNEFHRPLKIMDNLVSHTLIKILRDIKYPIPEHLYDFLEIPGNKYDVDTTIKCQKNSNTLLLPSDIKSFSHHLVEYILKMLYATSSYEKWKESFLSIFSQVEAKKYVSTDCNKVTSTSELYHCQEHIILEEIAQTVSAKIESFLLLKFKVYLNAGEIVDTDILKSIPEIQTEIEVHTKDIIKSLLGQIAESTAQQQTHDQHNTLYESSSKDDTSITDVLIRSMLDHICNEQINTSSEEWQPKSSTSHECLDAGCALHNVYDRSRLLDIASSILRSAFKQIMETIEVKSNQSTLGCETDISKCCQDSIGFLQMEINLLSKYIVEDLINMLCSTKQKIKEDKSLLKYQGTIVKGICETFIETISNSVLTDIFGKFRGFISLAVKVIHPSSKNNSEEIYFPGIFDHQNLLYGPAEDPKRKLKSIFPKSNLYKHSKHIYYEMLCVIQHQLEKLSNNIRHSLLEDEHVKSESSSLLVFEVEQIGLHSHFSQDEIIIFPQDTRIMQNIETNIRRNIVEKMCAHLKGKDSIKPDIVHEVKEVMFMLFKQLLVDLSVPLKLTYSSQMSRIHQRLLSETLLRCNQSIDSSLFSDSEVNDLSGDILKILSDIIHASNWSELYDRTESSNSNSDVLDTFGVKPINPVFTKLKNFVISKIETLFCQTIQKPLQSETKKNMLTDTKLESYARELADNILHQAEEHLHKRMKDIVPNDNFLPLSKDDIADHIVSVILMCLKYTYQHKETPNKPPSSGKEETQDKATKCNAMEIVRMVENIIKDTIENLTAINLSNLTLDICAKNLASSVLTLIQREIEQERKFMYGGKKYIIDKNTLATEIVNIILHKLYVKSVSCDTSLRNTSYNVDSVYAHTSKYEMTPKGLSASCSEPELATLIQQVGCVLHDVRIKTVLELKTERSPQFFYNETNESSSECLCETCLGFTSSDVEFVAKDIVEIIIAKISPHLQNILDYPKQSYEEHDFLLLEPDDTPCFSEQIKKKSHFVNNRNDRTNSMHKSLVEDSSLSHLLVKAVSDKTTAFAATIALKRKPNLPDNVKNEDIGIFLERVNNSSLRLEAYSKEIVMKVLEHIKPKISLPKFKSKLLHLHNMTQHEDIHAAHLIDTILHDLYFKYFSSSNVSEEVSYNVYTDSDIENGEGVTYPTASTPILPSSSSVNEQRRFSVTGIVSLTNSYTESDFENGEVVNHPKAFTPKPLPLSSNVDEQMFRVTGLVLSASSSTESDFEAEDHPRATTPKPLSSSSSSSVNEQRRLTVPEVASPTSSNTDSDVENGEAVLFPKIFTKRPSPNLNEQRSYNIRLHFL
ncbi:uncharacterized protein LOC142759959 isoform X2 [Rhinoderma darwinii]|uniref:uncharacterized protein LOC142759959 isoform X2 n=1 Tax=Rhinoderma darwinii TaxID=43563 RepID=UPI003F67B64A